jgi:hypothetical protein
MKDPAVAVVGIVVVVVTKITIVLRAVVLVVSFDLA